MQALCRRCHSPTYETLNTCTGPFVVLFPRLLPKRRQAFTPLPAVEDASGQLAPDREGRQELWRGHFAALENGEKLEPGAYPAAFREQRKAATAGRPCFDLGVVPTLTSVEQNVLGLRKGKACGQDGFTAELLQLSAIASARTLLPVVVKSILGVQEPVEFRGGALMPLAKTAWRTCCSVLLSVRTFGPLSKPCKRRVLPLPCRLQALQTLGSSATCRTTSDVALGPMTLSIFTLRTCPPALAAASSVLLPSMLPKPMQLA